MKTFLILAGAAVTGVALYYLIQFGRAIYYVVRMMQLKDEEDKMPNYGSMG